MDEGNDDRPVRSCRANVNVRCGDVNDVTNYHSKRYRGAIVNEPNRRHSKSVSSHSWVLLASGQVDAESDLMNCVVFV